MNGFDVGIKKLEQSRARQTQLTRDSPFFFEEIRKENVKEKKELNDWITIPRVAVGVGIVIAIVVIGKVLF